MKRIISFFMAMMFVLSVGAVSVSSADTEETIKNVEAVSVVTGLNIMSYYEDGTFRPDETVTRAEMAAIICRMTTYDEHAQSEMGLTVYNDVPSDHWASGYINLMQEQGAITGYGDGNFAPEDKVTYEQAVKMIISILGADILASYEGGYPDGYLKLALKQGILENTQCNVGDVINRETVATLVFNALEVPLAVWEEPPFGFHEIQDYRTLNRFTSDTTILSRYWEMQRWSGILVKDRKNFVLKDAECFECQDGGIFDKVKEPLGGVDFSRIGNINDFVGQKVDVYIGEDEDSGKNIAYIVVKK